LQLNFYGFRKLRSDPILTSDVDPCTSCYVRFYHEKFQRGRPELLQHIKRATKADQHSKDDIESLRNELADMKECFRSTTEEYDRKIADLSYECNRRITAMNAEYDNLAGLVHHLLGALQSSPSASHLSAGVAGCPGFRSAASASCPGQLMPPVPSFRPHAGFQSTSLTSSTVPNSTIPPNANPALQLSVNSDLLQSLSQAAVSLQTTLRASHNISTNTCDSAKRSAAECSDGVSQAPPCRRNRDSI
jgi:HSF-type DNA-binding